MCDFDFYEICDFLAAHFSYENVSRFPFMVLNSTLYSFLNNALIEFSA
jgi:hypothetical protein